MKKLFLFSFLFLLSCNAILDSPGTLGEAATNQLECSEGDVDYKLERLLETNRFKTSIKDTNVIDWWKRNKYDFLNYKCLKIGNRLYMITIDSENDTETDISIRSYYNRKREEWMFATEFKNIDEIIAEKAMKYLLKFISGC